MNFEDKIELDDWQSVFYWYGKGRHIYDCEGRGFRIIRDKTEIFNYHDNTWISGPPITRGIAPFYISEKPSAEEFVNCAGKVIQNLNRKRL